MNKNRKILTSILAVATITSSLNVGFADSKSNSQKTKEQMNSIKKEQSELSKKNKALESEINAKNTKIEDVTSNLENVLDRKIKNEELLQEIQIDLKESIKQLKSQISTYYMNSYTSNTTILETFIKSESLSDYIVTSNHLKYIVEDKDKKVDDVERLLEEQKKVIEKIKKDEEELLILKSNLNNEMSELQKTKSKYDSELITLNKQYEELEDILIVQQEEEERIKQEILAAQQASKKEEDKGEYNNQETSKIEVNTSSNTNTNTNSNTSSNTTSTNSGGWTSPLKTYTRISSLFGPRIHPVTGKYTNHGGMDIAAPTGTPIYSAKAGKVITSKYSSSYGNYIIVDHGNGLATLYAHLSQRNASVGDNVVAGELIGTVGSTGRSTGPHLHLELRKNGEKIDPQSVIPIG